MWKNGLFLESLDHLVKVLMRANIEKNSLEIVVRGAEVAVAKEIMTLIVGEMETVSKNYAGITMKYEEREGNGGNPKKWWDLTPSSKWEKKGSEEGGHPSSLGEIQFLSIYSNGVGKDEELFGKLKVALWSGGGSVDDIEEAFALHNPISAQAFDAHRILLATRHITTPSLFKKDNWNRIDSENAKKEILKGEDEEIQKDLAEKNALARAEMFKEHQNHLANFEWNLSEQLRVSLMVQGTTIEAGWSIAQGGFGVIAREGDRGWYGRVFTRPSR